MSPYIVKPPKDPALMTERESLEWEILCLEAYKKNNKTPKYQKAWQFRIDEIKGMFEPVEPVVVIPDYNKKLVLDPVHKKGIKLEKKQLEEYIPTLPEKLKAGPELRLLEIKDELKRSHPNYKEKPAEPIEIVSETVSEVPSPPETE